MLTNEDMSKAMLAMFIHPKPSSMSMRRDIWGDLDNNWHGTWSGAGDAALDGAEHGVCDFFSVVAAAAAEEEEEEKKKKKQKK